MDVLFCVCTGPVDAVRRLFYGEKLVKDLNLTTTGQINVVSEWGLNGGEKKEGGLAGNVTIYKGEDDQVFDSKLLGDDAAKSPDYRGVTSLMFGPGAGAGSFYWSAMSPYFKNPWFEVQRIVSGWRNGIWQESLAKVTASDGIDDMNPIHIIYECITNTDWGMGVNTNYIDDASFIAAATTCKNEKIGLSLLWQDQQNISDFIDSILDCISAVRYVDPSTGKIVVKLLRDDYDINTLPEFNPGNIIELSSFQRITYGEIPNEITLIYVNRMQDEETLTVQDLAMIDTEQAVVSLTISYQGVRTAELASRLITREIITKSAPLTKLTFKGTRALLKYNIGDRFKLVWPELDIINLVCRIIKKQMGALNDAFIEFEAIEEIFTSAKDSVNSGYDYTGGFNSGTGKGNVTSPDEFVFTATTQVIDKYRLLNLPLYFMWFNEGQQETLDRLDVDPNLTLMQIMVSPKLSSVDGILPYSHEGASYASAAQYTYLDRMIDLTNNAVLNRDILLWERDSNYIDVSITSFNYYKNIIWTVSDYPDDILKLRSAINTQYYDIRDNVFVFVDNEVFLLGGLKKTMDEVRLYRGCLGTVPRPHTKNTTMWFVWYGEAEYDPTVRTNAQSNTYAFVANHISHSDTVALALSSTRPNDHAVCTVSADISKPYNVRYPTIKQPISGSYGNFSYFCSFINGSPSDLSFQFRTTNRLLESGPTTNNSFQDNIGFTPETDTKLRMFLSKPNRSNLEPSSGSTEWYLTSFDTATDSNTTVTVPYTGNYIAREQGLEFEVAYYANSRLSNVNFRFNIMFEFEIAVATPLIADLKQIDDTSGKLIDVIGDGSTYIQGIVKNNYVVFGVTGGNNPRYHDVVGYSTNALTSVVYTGIYDGDFYEPNLYFDINTFTTNAYDVLELDCTLYTIYFTWRGNNTSSSSDNRNRQYYHKQLNTDYVNKIRNKVHSVYIHAQKDNMRIGFTDTDILAYGTYSANAFDPTVPLSYGYLPRTATPNFNKVSVGAKGFWRIDRIQIFASKLSGITIDPEHLLPDYSSLNKYELGNYKYAGNTNYHHTCAFVGNGVYFGLQNELVLEPTSGNCAYVMYIGNPAWYSAGTYLQSEFIIECWIYPAESGDFISFEVVNGNVRIRARFNDDDTVSLFYGDGSSTEIVTGLSFYYQMWNHFRMYARNGSAVSVAINGKVFVPTTGVTTSSNIMDIRLGRDTFAGKLCGVHYSRNRGYIPATDANFTSPQCPIGDEQAVTMIIARAYSDTQTEDTTHTITVPSGAASGDMLVLIVDCPQDVLSTATTSPEYTLRSSSYDSSSTSNMLMNIYTKAYASTDKTVVITLPVASTITAILYVVRGELVQVVKTNYTSTPFVFTKTLAKSELITVLDQNSTDGSSTVIPKAIGTPRGFTNIDKLSRTDGSLYYQQLSVDDRMSHPIGDIYLTPNWEAGSTSNFQVVEFSPTEYIYQSDDSYKNFTFYGYRILTVPGTTVTLIEDTLSSTGAYAALTLPQIKTFVGCTVQFRIYVASVGVGVYQFLNDITSNTGIGWRIQDAGYPGSTYYHYLINNGSKIAGTDFQVAINNKWTKWRVSLTDTKIIIEVDGVEYVNYTHGLTLPENTNIFRLRKDYDSSYPRLSYHQFAVTRYNG